MSELVNQFGAILREEHREVRDALTELNDAFWWRVPEYSPGILRKVVAIAGPHIRYEGEVLYPALTEVVGEEYMGELLAENTQFSRSVERLGQLASKEVWSNEEAKEGVELVRHLLLHVHNCDGLVAIVERLPEEKVRKILSVRQRLQLAGPVTMAQTQTDISSEHRRGHANIEGTLDTPSLQFDLGKEIEELRKEESWNQETGRSSKTLVKYPDLRIVLIVMKAKTRMHEHKATARISVQTISGHIRLHLPNRTVDLPAGNLVTLDQCLEHDVEALEESAFLLSISWPPEADIEACKTSKTDDYRPAS